MNMMVNTSELVGNEAEKTKLNGIALKSAVSKLVASWERKQAGKLGSFGLMAISLAACNASSTAVVEEEAEAEAPAPVVPVTNAITIAAATTNAFGTANQDIITAAQADLTSAHIIADATTGDNDSLTVTLTGDYAATPTVIGVETVTFNIGETLASGNGTLSVAVDNITASNDSIHFDVTNAESLIANLTVTGAGTNNYAPSTELTTVEIQSVADADVTVTLAADMSLSTTTGAGDDLTVNGGTAFDVTLTASTATEDLVVSGLDNTITAASILGNVTVTSAGDTALTAVAAVGNVTITGGDDVTAADVRASTGTVTINSTGIIGGVDARAATTLVANNTGAPSGEDVTITNASAATAVTLTSVGSITATANSMAAAAAVTATAAEDSAITADGVADQVLNLNADSSGVALTPEVTYTILASTVETINLGGPTAIEVIIDPADISTETVTSTNATSAALNFGTSNSADTTEVASGIVMRLGIDHDNKTFTVANSNNFALLDNIAQTAGTAAVIFDHTTAGTITSNNTMTLSTYDDDGAAAGDQAATVAGLTFTDVNDLTIAMSAVGITSSADITGADLESITITGSGGFLLGTDTITGNASASLSDVTVDASAVTGIVTMALDATAAGVEVLSTGTAADVITIGGAASSGGSHSVTTNAGNDTVDITGAANFTYDGGGGIDTLSIGAGINISANTFTLTSVERIEVTGGGTQTIAASYISGKTFLLSEDGTGTGAITISMDQAGVDVSNLAPEGSWVDGTDKITISAASVGLPCSIIGSSGSDVITGSAAVDSIVGGEGQDVILSGAGADTINITETTAVKDEIQTTGGHASIDVVTGWTTSDMISIDVSDSGVIIGGDGADDADGIATQVEYITGQEAVLAAENVYVFDGDYATTALFETAIEAGGTRQLTLAGAATADDDIVVAYDNGTDTFVGTVNINAGATTLGGASALTVLVQLVGVSDATTLLTANFDLIA